MITEEDFGSDDGWNAPDLNDDGMTPLGETLRVVTCESSETDMSGDISRDTADDEGAGMEVADIAEIESRSVLGEARIRALEQRLLELRRASPVDLSAVAVVEGELVFARYDERQIDLALARQLAAKYRMTLEALEAVRSVGEGGLSRADAEQMFHKFAHSSWSHPDAPKMLKSMKTAERVLLRIRHLLLGHVRRVVEEKVDMRGNKHRSVSSVCDLIRTTLAMLESPIFAPGAFTLLPSWRAATRKPSTGRERAERLQDGAERLRDGADNCPNSAQAFRQRPHFPTSA